MSEQCRSSVGDSCRSVGPGLRLHTVQHVTRESANAHLADAVPCCGQRVEKELLSVRVREGPGALSQLRDHLRALEGVQVVA